MDMDEVLLETEERMQKAVEFFAGQLGSVRTGRASPALVEHIKVEYYGTKTPIRELCAISVPEPQLMVIRPFDPSSLKEVEKAVLKADLGIAPMNDGKILRLVMPPLTEESRRQMSGKIKDMSQEAKTSVRNIRRDANRNVDKIEKESSVPEDEAFRVREEIQELTGKYEGKLDAILDSKTKEIMEL
jgi:ribosome recycling factor